MMDHLRYAVCMFLVMAMSLIGIASVPAQKILEENPYYLRADERLQVSLQVKADHPKLLQMTSALHAATGLDITVDDRLQGHDPDFGYIQPSKDGYRAWQIMEMVAKNDLQRGYWEKTERGYRLTSALPLPAVAKANSVSRPSQFARLLWKYFLSFAPLLILLAIVNFRRWRQKQQADAVSERCTDSTSPPVENC